MIFVDGAKESDLVELPTSFFHERVITDGVEDEGFLYAQLAVLIGRRFLCLEKLVIALELVELLQVYRQNVGSRLLATLTKCLGGVHEVRSEPQ